MRLADGVVGEVPHPAQAAITDMALGLPPTSRVIAPRQADLLLYVDTIVGMVRMFALTHDVDDL